MQHYLQNNTTLVYHSGSATWIKKVFRKSADFDQLQWLNKNLSTQ